MPIMCVPLVAPRDVVLAGEMCACRSAQALLGAAILALLSVPVQMECECADTLLDRE